MSCRVKNENEEKVTKMKDLPGGKIAVILGHHENGRLVQRDSNPGNGFVILGGKSFSGKHSNGYSNNNTLPIRILEEGELIEVRYS